MEMGSNELQTFSMDESGQSGSPHEITIRRSKGHLDTSRFDNGLAIMGSHTFSIGRPECWYTINEPRESCAVKIDLIEESYIQDIESGEDRTF